MDVLTNIPGNLFKIYTCIKSSHLPYTILYVDYILKLEKTKYKGMHIKDTGLSCE